MIVRGSTVETVLFRAPEYAGPSKEVQDQNYQRRKNRRNKKKDKGSSGDDDDGNGKGSSTSDKTGSGGDSSPGDKYSGSDIPPGNEPTDKDSGFTDPGDIISPPLSTPTPLATDYPTWSPTRTPVPTITSFPSASAPEGSVGGQGSPSTLTQDTTSAPTSLSTTGPIVSPTSAPIWKPTGVPSAPPTAPMPTTDPSNTSILKLTSAPSLKPPPPTAKPTLAPVVTPSSSPVVPTGVPVPNTRAPVQPTERPVPPSPVPIFSTPAPTFDEISLACQALSDGIAFVTNRKIDITYFYELLTTSAFDIDNVVDALESKVTTFLAKVLVPCNQGPRRHLVTLGVGPGPADQPSGGSCTKLTVTGTEECYYMLGSIQLFISSDSKLTQNDASALVFTILEKSFNGDDSRRRLAESEFLDSSAGIFGLYFDGGLLGEEIASGSVPINSAQGAPINQRQSLGALGIGLIAAACTITLLVLALAFRRRARQAKDFDGALEMLDREPYDSPDRPEKVRNAFSHDTEATMEIHYPAKVASDDSSIYTGFEEDIPYYPSAMESEVHVPPLFLTMKGEVVPMPSIYMQRDYVVSDTVDF